MAMRSARLSGDPVLNQCQAGTHRMLEPEANLSVMRVQEGLSVLGFFDGEFDGFFGPVTGNAVSDYKVARSLSPSDPVVGPGTSSSLDDELFSDPPSLDPAFGEVSSFVARHVVEPFIGLTLAPLISAPLNSQRHDVGSFMLAALNSGFLVGIVAASRVSDLLGDNRIPPDVKAALADLGPAAGQGRQFLGTDGNLHEVVVVDDLSVRGLRILIHRPSGRTHRVELIELLCHELAHVRNAGLNLDLTPAFDTDTFLDPALAQQLSVATGHDTPRVFNQFVEEMCARHVAWIVQRERDGDPFALRFLQPVALAEAAHFYFAETDPVFMFDDNGYMQTIRDRGHAATFQQIALWLRRTSTMTFSGNPQIQQASALVFRDAADSAELTALNPGLARPIDDGLFPGTRDMH
ncbi:hypothetical protein TUM20985_19740 [Mycobacterium antarcticum]|uniref:hypothetical protein n=1 Tax=unclassified Mycolicibacterium TaxID=2636767 RepID=UPI0023A61D93|nr:MULTISPECIES: hypothetical protein [unclassified Mycolicibacterium]BDX31427.1 hypothetical protein TUM20985_19740 [Mycolicibacterium sp. TUM20985]GLP74779.1 hypothetical protein TUM20983_18890 [Mycolicibacterium sp. TUM20983]